MKTEPTTLVDRFYVGYEGQRNVLTGFIANVPIDQRPTNSAAVKSGKRIIR